MKISINRNLALLLSGQLVSQVGDKFYLLALSYFVLKSTGSPALMGVVLAAALIPSLLVGFISGAFIDRYNRKMIIVAADVIRGVIITFIGIAYIMGFLNFSMILFTDSSCSVNFRKMSSRSISSPIIAARSRNSLKVPSATNFP